MAHEAIIGHIETLLMDDQPIPDMRALEVHLATPDFADGVWALVDVDLPEPSGMVIGA